MMRDDFNCKNKFECDDCSIKGICSFSPTSAAIKSVIFAFLQELAFYILKVMSFGGKNEQIKNNFIEIFSILISNSEYSEASLSSVLNIIFETLLQVKELYKELCKQNNSSIKYYKTQIRLSKNYTLTDVIKQGQKYSQRLKENFNQEQRNGFDIIIIILKSICLYMIELQSLDVDIDNYYKEVLYLIGSKSYENITSEEIMLYVNKLSKSDAELLNLLCQARQEHYGKFIETEILVSHKKGKAILVAGNNMKEMEMLLEATKDKGVDIYTHGQMITAHTLPKLKAYPHLIGNYGKSIDTYMTDFSLFPGSIFLTKLSLYRLESIYRGGIYTTDKIVSKGISRIKDNDFEPLIKSALSAEGFEDCATPKIMKFGFTEEAFNIKNNELIEKVMKNEIKTFFLVGVSNYLDSQNEYFEKLFNLIGRDSFIYSFFPVKENENTFFVSFDYGPPLLYKFLNLFLPLKEKFKFRINVLATRCDAHTVPTIIDIKNSGVDRVYIGNCSPNLFNPALIDYVSNMFNINRYTVPDIDLKNMLGN